MWKRRLDPPTPETLALLSDERAFPHAPDDLRRYALTRAAKVGAALASSFPRARTGGRILLMAAAGIAVLGLAAAALLQRSDKSESATQVVASAAANVAAPRFAREAPPQLAAPAAPALTPAPPVAPSARVKEGGDGRRAELTLVESARRSLSAGDYTATLTQLAEHERRFARGVFVEEREAMRVKALWGLGRATQARSAVSQFRTRFPRSVLLPSLERLVRPVP